MAGGSVPGKAVKDIYATVGLELTTRPFEIGKTIARRLGADAEFWRNVKCSAWRKIQATENKSFSKKTSKSGCSCKTLAGSRREKSGSRWSKPGANALLVLKSCRANTQWHDLHHARRNISPPLNQNL